MQSITRNLVLKYPKQAHLLMSLWCWAGEDGRPETFGLAEVCAVAGKICVLCCSLSMAFCHRGGKRNKRKRKILVSNLLRNVSRNSHIPLPLNFLGQTKSTVTSSFEGSVLWWSPNSKNQSFCYQGRKEKWMLEDNLWILLQILWNGIIALFYGKRARNWERNVVSHCHTAYRWQS